jgi:SAM-dependent methyltransferase
MLVNIISDLHGKTKRNYLGRMTDDKIECMYKARWFEQDYFDGDRKYGYGGYYCDGRWKPIAQKLINKYKLTSDSQVLDIGCGKGFLLYEIQKLINCKVVGVDRSDYARQNSVIKVTTGDLNGRLMTGKFKIGIDYDLILSINVLHNICLPHLKNALQEIESHCSNAYICMDSYRDDRELFNLQCWTLTAEQFLRPEEWEFLFKEWGYTKDYEFIFFE